MADDTVAAARQAYLLARSVWFNHCGIDELAQREADAKLDALIAAVRAERQETITQLQETLTAALEAWKTERGADG